MFTSDLRSFSTDIEGGKRIFGLIVKRRFLVAVWAVDSMVVNVFL